ITIMTRVVASDWSNSDWGLWRWHFVRRHRKRIKLRLPKFLKNTIATRSPWLGYVIEGSTGRQIWPQHHHPMFEDKIVPSLVVLSTRRERTTLSLIRRALTSVVVVVFAIRSLPLHAQLIVNDPLNYAQNVLTAARSLQQINIALMGLANQLKMLQNQYQHLL